MSNLNPGIYEAVSEVNIRREPKIVEVKIGKNFITNRVGGINTGTQKMVYSVTTNSKGETWGRISESDSAGIAQWICIQNTNRKFMKPLDEQAPVVVHPSGLDARIAALEAWARTKGFEA